MKNIKRISLFVIFLCMLAWVLPSYAAPAVAVGRVVWVKGSLNAIAPDKAVRKLNKLSVFYLNDTLKTDANSQAQIVFTDNTLMTFKPHSTFLVKEYKFNPKQQKSAGKYVMNLITGGFRTITGLVAKNHPDDYQVNTPVATIGVRGTDYAVYLDKGELFIGNYSGKPCVNNKKGNVCLDEKKKYAKVQSSDQAPVPLSEQPAGFADKLEIIPAKIAISGTGGSGTGTDGTSSGSFCIVQ